MAEESGGYEEVIGTLTTVMAVNYDSYLHGLHTASSALTSFFTSTRRQQAEHWKNNIKEEERDILELTKERAKKENRFFTDIYDLRIKHAKERIEMYKPWLAAEEKAVSNLKFLAFEFAAVGVAIGYAWYKAVPLVAHLNEQAERLQTSTGFLSQWSAAGVLAGKSAEEFGNSIESLHNRIREMSMMPVTSISQLMGGGYRPFTMLGLNPFQMRNMGAEDQLRLIADRLSQVKDKTLQLSIAQELFGDSGYYMLHYLKDGSAGVDELKRKMDSFNTVLTTEQAEAIQEAVMAWREFKLAMQGVYIQISAAVAPIIQVLIGTLGILAQWVGTLLHHIPLLNYALLYLALALLGVQSSLSLVIVVVVFLMNTIPYLTTVIEYLTAAVVALGVALWLLDTNPVMAVITLIAIAILALLYFTGMLDKFKAAMGETMRDTTHDINSNVRVSSSTASPETSQILRDIANSARGQLMTTKEMVEQLKKAGPPHMNYSW